MPRRRAPPDAAAALIEPVASAGARSRDRADGCTGRAGPEEAEHMAAADAVGGAGLVHQDSGSATPSTVCVSCESGSARALTWSDSAFLSASVSSA